MFENLNDVKIIGRAPELNEIIIKADRILQDVANAAQNVKGMLMVFSDPIQGEQYQKACTAVKDLSENLYNKSEFINSVQHDLVDYIDRVAAFNDRPPEGLPPMPHNVTIVNVEATLSNDQFTKDAYIFVKNALRAYVEDVEVKRRELVSAKENIGAIWKDSQYRQFSDAIDEVSLDIIAGAQALDSYILYLEGKISQM